MKKLVLLSALMFSTVTYGMRPATSSGIIINGKAISARSVKGALVTSWVSCVAIGVATITYCIMKRKRDKEVERRVEKRLEEERLEAQEMKS